MCGPAWRCSPGRHSRVPFAVAAIRPSTPSARRGTRTGLAPRTRLGALRQAGGLCPSLRPRRARRESGDGTRVVRLLGPLLACRRGSPLSFRRFRRGSRTGQPVSRSPRAVSRTPELYGPGPAVGFSAFRPPGPARSSVSLLAGVKRRAPARTTTRIDGERVDEHAQPGTGSTDLFGSLGCAAPAGQAVGSLRFRCSYRHTGENDYAYRYGRHLPRELCLREKAGRKARQRDRAELPLRGIGRARARRTSPNTGGLDPLLYAPAARGPGRGLVLRGAVQIPIARDLNGAQEEKAVFNLGLSFLFGSR